MKINWHYIAGFFDGEGSCGLYPARCGNGTIRANIAQRDPRILAEIQTFLKEHGIESLLRISTSKTQLSNNPCHVLEIFGKNAPKFLGLIHPYLRTYKKTTAQDIVRYKKIFPPMTHQMRGKLSAESRWGVKSA